MFCPNCSTELIEAVRFCPECGHNTGANLKDQHNSIIDEEYTFLRNRYAAIRGISVIDMTTVNLKDDAISVKKEQRIFYFFNRIKMNLTLKIGDINSIVVKKELIKTRLIGVMLIMALVLIFGLERPWRALIAIAYAAYLFSGRYCRKVEIDTGKDIVVIPYEASGEKSFDAMVGSIMKLNPAVVVKKDF